MTGLSSTVKWGYAPGQTCSFGQRHVECEHLAEEDGDNIVARIAAAVLDEDALLVAQGESVRDEFARGGDEFFIVKHDAAGAEGFRRDDNSVHGLAAVRDNSVVASGDESGGAANFGACAYS